MRARRFTAEIASSMIGDSTASNVARSGTILLESREELSEYGRPTGDSTLS